MKISRLIKKLEEIKEKHGDLRIYHLGIDHGWRDAIPVVFDKEGCVVLAGGHNVAMEERYEYQIQNKNSPDAP